MVSRIQNWAEADNWSFVYKKVIAGLSGSGDISPSSANYIMSKNPAQIREAGYEHVLRAKENNDMDLFQQRLANFRLIAEDDQLDKLRSMSPDELRAEKESRELLKDKEDQEKKQDRLKAAIDLQDFPSIECNGELQCSRVFSLVQVFVSNNADMKIQVAASNVIETYNPNDFGDVAFKAQRVPVSGAREKISLQAICKGMTGIVADEGSADYMRGIVCKEKMLKMRDGYESTVLSKVGKL